MKVLEHDWFPRPLPANVELGERSWLHSAYAFLHYRSTRPCGVRIGRDTGIYRNTFFELGPTGEVEIGDFCTVVGAIFATRGRIVIGDYSFLAHEVVLADSCHAVPPDRADVESALPTPTITIGANAWIGARAILLAGARIGAGAIIGAAAVVAGPVPDYAIVAGCPARVVGHALPK
jgi:acetyltransferase-like isoleucine patch superfamily enzyme